MIGKIIRRIIEYGLALIIIAFMFLAILAIFFLYYLILFLNFLWDVFVFLLPFLLAIGVAILIYKGYKWYKKRKE